MIEASQTTVNELWAKNQEFFEYTSAANPRMPKIDVKAFPSSMHEIDETKIIPLDLSADLQTSYPATGPTLLANYVHVAAGESIETGSGASSQVFFVIRGTGVTETEDGPLAYSEGDYFALPGNMALKHIADTDTALYWVTDEPLLKYMGAICVEAQVRPVYFSHETLEAELAKVVAENEGKDRNRNGVLLGNVDCPVTKTVTHTMWSLYNLLPRQTRQKAHRHNSIALDYCVKAGPNTYTLIGKRLDEDGNIIDPIRADWKPGCVFVTPPGWWHSHHNESDEDAIVLPVQDAGLHTQAQTLDIRFARGY